MKKYYNFETMFSTLKKELCAMLKNNGIYYEISDGRGPYDAAMIWYFEILATPAGYDDILYDEYYNDIIIPATRDNIGINGGNYSELYKTIEKYADDMAGELIDVKNNILDYYENAAECITDYLNIDDISSEHAETIAHAAWRYYDNKIDFNEYAAAILTALTPHKWRAAILRGCCQGDVVRAIYPADVYNGDDISEYECYYFGMYFDYCATYKNISVWYTRTYNTTPDEIIDEIRADYSTNNIRYCPAY